MIVPVKPVTEIRFVVPLVPPSVNHYKEPWEYTDRESGKVRQTYKLTPEAKAFKQAIAVFAPAGETLSPATERERLRVRYGLDVRIFLGKKQRMDGDNAWKCIADGLEEAGVIHSDARVRVWHLEIGDEDRENPRTEIHVWVVSRPAVARKVVVPCAAPQRRVVSTQNPRTSLPLTATASKYASVLCGREVCTSDAMGEWWKQSRKPAP